MFENIDLWVKAFHIISVIAWMAALLYLPRLFIYHFDAEKGSVQSETFKTMERRLLKVIATPAMLSTWIFGFWIASLQNVWSEPWFHVKLLLVIILSGIHMAYAKYTRLFANDANQKSQKFFRVINEIPALLMVIIIIMVVVKPF